MINKLILITALMLIMAPASAFAGSYSIAVTSGSATGTVGPAPLSGYASTAKNFTATAAANYALSSVTRNGVNVTSNTTYVNGTGPWAVTIPLSNTSQTFYVNFKQVVQATPTLVAVLPAGITIPVNTPTLVSGANSTIANLQSGTQATFTFSGSGLAFIPASGQVTTPAGITTNVTAAAPGTYTATLTLKAPGATPSSANVLITVQPPGIAASGYCLNCHNGWNEANKYVVSGHAASANGPSCQSCHNPGLALQHPGYSTSDTNANPGLFYSCVTCHFPGSSIVSSWPPNGLDFHNDYNGTNQCMNCHNPHNPSVVSGMAGVAHFNNITTAGYPASYMTSRSACSNCHVSGSENPTVRHQWARSGHADYNAPAWTVYDFKTISGCVQCHTTTGFIAYSTARVTEAWGTASDKTKEVLTCVGCHSDVANGIVRTATPARPFADDAYVNRNVGESNICMDCHSGRNNGLSITGKVGTADFTNISFVAPHYLAAGGTLHGKGGYNFPGQTYAFYSSSTHRTIGIGNSNGTGTAGPCVVCHMTAPRKHLFQAISTASNGAIGGITASVCANCHGGSLSVTQLTASKAAFANSLEVLKAMLAEKGFVYMANYPYFMNTNWGYGQGGANTMGAAFNYVLLLKEPGAYAHNGDYTRKLIFDSIDYLYNGTITGSIDSAVNELLSEGKITSEIAASATTYSTSNSCGGCHGYPPAYPNGSPKANSHSSHNFGCGTCHASTTTDGVTISDRSKHVNGVYDVTPGSGVSFTYTYAATGGTCANISCHGGTNATWGGTLSCAACHGYPPAPNILSSPAAFGTMNNWSSARVEDYSGGGGAHIVSGHIPKTARPADGWVNCIPCHYGGPASHAKTITADGHFGNASVAIDPQYGFTPGVAPAYDPVSKSCSNVSCHGVPSGTFSYWFMDGAGDPLLYTVPYGGAAHQTPSWTTTGAQCIACHDNPPYNAPNQYTWHSGWHGNVNINSARNTDVLGLNKCDLCHSDVVSTITGTLGTATATMTTTIANSIMHRNGTPDVQPKWGTSCFGCH